MKRLVLLATLAVACSEKPKPIEQPVADPTPQPITAPPFKVGKKSLLFAQAQFEWVEENGERRAKPGAAKLVVLTRGEGGFKKRVIEDPESRVFHKAACVDGGVLTIGATQAKLKLWAPDLATSQTLWTVSFGGKWDRLRDFEFVDADNLAIATHDQGVVALLTRTKDGWVAKELSRKADTFVHEIEVGDVDRDGKAEIYATPSDPNKVKTSQGGSVVTFTPPDWTMSQVAAFQGSHAKEILVADLDSEAPGVELYAAVEAELAATPGAGPSQPVEIRQYVKGAAGRWIMKPIAKLERAIQARVLLAADLMKHGHPDLVVTTMKDGIWRLTPAAGGALWTASQIDAESTGFEHAAQAYDTDGDGLAELYVAADDQDEIRSYVWNGETLQRTTIATLEKSDITWSIMGCGREY